MCWPLSKSDQLSHGLRRRKTTRDDEADLMLTMPMKAGQEDEGVGLKEAVSFPALIGLPLLRRVRGNFNNFLRYSWAVTP